jgi:hypothetical protein
MNNELWGVTMVADEEDIMGYNLSHMFEQGVEKIIVANNLSTDNTAKVLDDMAWRYPGRLIVQQDDDPAHYQSRKITAMAEFAYKHGARFIIPFDADELWYAFDGETLHDAICRHPKVQCIGVPMWNHFCTSKDDDTAVNPFKRMLWRTKERNALDKIAVRFKPGMIIDEGNHMVRGIDGRFLSGAAVGLGIRHFPYRSAEHFIRKAERGGKALELAKGIPETVGLHWRQYRQSIIEHGAEAVKEHYKRWFTAADPEAETSEVMYDPAPYKGLI